MEKIYAKESKVAFGGTTAPTGWAICNGGTMSRTSNPALFAAIGTNYGFGDGSSVYASNIFSDGSNGANRITSETRPVNLYVNFISKL